MGLLSQGLEDSLDEALNEVKRLRELAGDIVRSSEVWSDRLGKHESEPHFLQNRQDLIAYWKTYIYKFPEVKP